MATHNPAGQGDMFGFTPAPGKLAPNVPKRTGPTVYIIPAGTRATSCTGEDCGKPMYWVGGVAVPLSADVEGGIHPTSSENGRGHSHFLNCPNAEQFAHSGRGGTRRSRFR